MTTSRKEVEEAPLEWLEIRIQRRKDWHFAQKRQDSLKIIWKLADWCYRLANKPFSRPLYNCVIGLTFIHFSNRIPIHVNSSGVPIKSEGVKHFLTCKCTQTALIWLCLVFQHSISRHDSFLKTEEQNERMSRSCWGKSSQRTEDHKEQFVSA